MKRVRTLSVIFDTEINSHETEAFRGAVIQKAGLQHTLFHNHAEDDQFIYNYPCIQYKRIRGKPMLYCIDRGVDEVHHFFNNKNRDILISGRKLELNIDRLDLKNHVFQVWNHSFKYRISHWLALNQSNYKKFMLLKNEDEKRQMLASILTANILSMAKALRWHVDKSISLEIEAVKRTHTVVFKKNKLMAFDVDFKANVSLPQWISLGKGASHGFGVVWIIKKEKKENDGK
ncbi:MAG: CRISPR-associated endonuclease Cas6 [Chitinophagaceae bacterium]|nr:CRISPR-associated endonuclease Cas6 [Chitinophagaceae bacterium]